MTAANDIFFVNCSECCTVVYCSFSCRDRDGNHIDLFVGELERSRRIMRLPAWPRRRPRHRMRTKTKAQNFFGPFHNLRTVTAPKPTNPKPPILGLSIPGGTDIDATRRMLEQFCSTHSIKAGPPVITVEEHITFASSSPSYRKQTHEKNAIKSEADKAKKLKRNQKKRSATHRKKAALAAAQPVLTDREATGAIMSAIRLMSAANKASIPSANPEALE